MIGVRFYMVRGDGHFERYTGARNQRWMGWPSVFSKWFDVEKPARFYDHTYSFGEVRLLSREEPKDATWRALEAFIRQSETEQQ
jgi:hypothetical protein